MAKFYYRTIRTMIAIYSLCCAAAFFFFYETLFSIFTDDPSVYETLGGVYYVICCTLCLTITTRSGMGAVRALQL